MPRRCSAFATGQHEAHHRCPPWCVEVTDAYNCVVGGAFLQAFGDFAVLALMAIMVEGPLRRFRGEDVYSEN